MFELNWVDIGIIVVVSLHVLQGWEEGLAKLGTDLLAFLAALWFSIRYHSVVGVFLADKFGLSGLWSGVAGYAVVWFVAEFLVGYLVGWLVNRLPKGVLTSQVNRGAGAALSALKALVLTAFGLLVILALPVRGSVKADIRASRIGSSLVEIAQRYAGEVTSELDRVIDQTVSFITIKPSSTERVDLTTVVDRNPTLIVDEPTENQMLDLVNAERVKVGVGKLSLDTSIRTVARAYSRDMFERKYFAHYSPEGEDVGDRLTKAKISYQIAGENLAYAPDLKTAHAGLMDSEGHRKNILNPEFHKIGIGVISGGVYGLMVTQVFTN